MKTKLYIFLIVIASITKQSQAQIITTVTGNGTQGYSGDGGQAINAELYGPAGMAVDTEGNIYIPDEGNNRIRKVNTTGFISTIAGTGIAGYSGDGGQATAAELYDPTGLAFDVNGNLYIADYENERIRKINTAGIITTVAGKSTHGYSGDGGQATAAELYSPMGISIDAVGNLYIADANNSCIRKVNTAGIITTIAGSGSSFFGGGYSGDGGAATAAELYSPQGVSTDAIGNVYIYDNGNNRIRMVNTAGIISTVAGNGIQGFSGDGGQATAAGLYLLNGSGVTIDVLGNLYISDWGNERIRKVNSLGIISTIAGNGTIGFSGDGGQAINAELYSV